MSGSQVGPGPIGRLGARREPCPSSCFGICSVMRRILLADADAFYVAVARAVDPDGAGTAPLLIVGGARDSRGVVCSASYETRKFGVRSAMPIARALRLSPDALCFPVPLTAFSPQSAQTRDLHPQS